MTKQEVSRAVWEISGNMYTLANDDAFKENATDATFIILQEYLRDTAFTLDKIQEVIDGQVEKELEEEK